MDSASANKKPWPRATQESGGGVASNASVAIARLGSRVRRGRCAWWEILAELALEGADVRDARRIPRSPSA